MKKILFLIALAVPLSLSAKPKFVTYEKYGAKGDGKTDDMEAIVAAHEAANEWNIPVKAKNGRTYYIGATTKTAVIKTDVDWGTAHFIIDDTKPEKVTRNIFRIDSDIDPIKVKGVKSLSKGQPNLGVTLPSRSLVVVKYDDKRLYIRYGVNENSGQPQKECLVVEKDGTIDPRTAVMWDYEAITSVTAYPIPENTLTITGGIFTTIANDKPAQSSPYAQRNILIKRSNTKITGLKHFVVDEGPDGAPYGGFLNVNTCAECVVENVVLTGHKTYVMQKKKGKSSRGTYDLSVNTAANILFRNITQSDDIDDTKHWGLMGSNYCKNLTMDGCKVSRFDAHQGVENVTLKNCTFGHMGVRMVGCGTIYLENCEMRYNTVVALRQDYGSTWDGDIIVRNCTLRPVKTSYKELTILSGNNRGNHDFGYPCRVPHLIDVDGLVIDDSAITGSEYQGVRIFSSFSYNTKKEGLLPFGTDCKVILKNVTVKSGKPITLSTNEGLFKDVIVEKL